jgi:hypothetical protein
MSWLQRFFSSAKKVERSASQQLTEIAFRPILSQAQLASEIRLLTVDEREPSTEELVALQDRFSRNLASELPHFIAHWFADADIRQRDAEYRKSQKQQLEAALRQMESLPSA